MVCRVPICDLTNGHLLVAAHRPPAPSEVEPSEEKPIGQLKPGCKNNNVQNGSGWGWRSWVMSVINVLIFADVFTKKRDIPIIYQLHLHFCLHPRPPQHHWQVIKTTWIHSLNICDGMYIIQDYFSWSQWPLCVEKRWRANDTFVKYPLHYACKHDHKAIRGGHMVPPL